MPRIKDNLSNHGLINSKWIGHCAQRTMANEGTGAILGVTGKGFFIAIKPGEVIFVSGDIFRGPITINLESMLNFKAFFNIGETCQVRHDQLIFKEYQLLIDRNTPIWDPQPIRLLEDGVYAALQRGTDLVRTLILAYREGYFYSLLDFLVSQSFELIQDKLLSLIPGIKKDGDILSRLPGLLGLGRGLTPAGDDFLCGFLLVNFCLRQSPTMMTFESDFYHAIVAQAHKRTTALSAALIQCAAKGEGDERLLDALGWIAQGDGKMTHARESLLSYGSSSGLDALAGMLTALLFIDYEKR